MNDKDLIGKKVYFYRADSKGMYIGMKTIADAFEEDDITKVKLNSGDVVHLDSIGNTAQLTDKWFTFERNDQQARMILFGYAKWGLSDYMQEMIEKMEKVKKNYEYLFDVISNSKIKQDNLHWEDGEEK